MKIFLLIIWAILLFQNTTYAADQDEVILQLEDDLSVKLSQKSAVNKSFVKQDREMIFEMINDAFTADETDKHLTNVLKVGFISEKLPGFLDWYQTTDNKEYYAVTLTQEMYTPDNLDNDNLVVDDRPFAGWLYLTFTLMKRKNNRLGVTIIDMGIIGPNSLAEETQAAFHDLLGLDEPRGWDNQLNNEFGINIKHFESRGIRISKDQFDADMIGFVGGSLGNVDTSATVGVVLRAGINVPDDMLIGHSEVYRGQQNWSLYSFIGVSETAVVHDIFLDGNTFSDSHSVDKKDLLTKFKAGVTARYKNFELTYVYRVTSEQFEGQDGPDHYGAILLKFKVRF